MKNLITNTLKVVALVIMLVAITCNCSKGQGFKNKGQKKFFKTCKSKGYKPSKSKTIKFKGSKGKTAKVAKKSNKKTQVALKTPTTVKPQPTASGIEISNSYEYVLVR